MKAANIVMYSALAAGAAAAGWIALTSGVLLSPLTAAAEYISGAAQGFTNLIPSPEAVTTYVSQNPALIVTGVFSVGAAGYGLIQKVISSRRESAAAVKLQELQTQNLDISGFASSMAAENKTLKEQVAALKTSIPDVSAITAKYEASLAEVKQLKTRLTDFEQYIKIQQNPSVSTMKVLLEKQGYTIHKIVA